MMDHTVNRLRQELQQRNNILAQAKLMQVPTTLYLPSSTNSQPVYSLPFPLCPLLLPLSAHCLLPLSAHCYCLSLLIFLALHIAYCLALSYLPMELCCQLQQQPFSTAGVAPIDLGRTTNPAALQSYLATLSNDLVIAALPY